MKISCAKKLSVAIAVLAISAALGSTASARGKVQSSPDTTYHAANADAPDAAQAHTLQKSYFTFGNSFVAVNSGFQPLDAAFTITCPAAGCTIAVDSTVQAIGNGTTGNTWAICPRVDGNFLHDPECAIAGVLDNNFVTTETVSQDSGHLGPGVHTLQTFTYSDLGMNQGHYRIQYRQYKP